MSYFQFQIPLDFNLFEDCTHYISEGFAIDRFCVLIPIVELFSLPEGESCSRHYEARFLFADEDTFFLDV